jgi:hypothetical protein
LMFDLSPLDGTRYNLVEGGVVVKGKCQG